MRKTLIYMVLSLMMSIFVLGNSVLIKDQKNPIDIDRIYIAGLSRAGEGTWNAVRLELDKFADIGTIARSGGVRSRSLIKNGYMGVSWI